MLLARLLVVGTILLLGIGCSSGAKAGDDLAGRMVFWEAQAFLCTEGGKSFPSKERQPTSDNPSRCDSGDMNLFNGLLCLSGDNRGCNGVRDSQDKDGRWWRSPINIGKESSSGSDVSFSPDMALGTLGYALETKDKQRFDNWIAWIDDHRPCVVEPGGICLIKGWPRFCTDDPDKRCTMRPSNCAELELVGTQIGSPSGDICRKVLRTFKIRDDYIIPVAELTAGGALLNDPGYPMHLAAVELFILERASATSSFTRLAALSLALREPKNPFFLYLSEGKTERVKRLVLELCPSPAKPSISRTQWAWEREAADKAWEKSMYWDCIFMGRLLNS